MERIETVCFDLDNTLCVNAKSDEEVHEELFEQVGMEPPFDVADVRNVDPAALPEVDSRRAFYEELYRAVTDDLAPGRYRKLAEATLEVVDETDVEFRAGAREAHRYARTRYPVGLLTYGDPDVQLAKLDRLGIREAFDAVVVCGPATDLPGKPAPEPFEYILAELGASPETSLYVGDSLHGDVAGAAGVGMGTAWVPAGGVPGDPGSESELVPEPTYTLDSPADLLEVL